MEIIIASSILVAMILSALSVAQKSIALSRQGVHAMQANFLLEEGAEVVRILRDNAWSNVSSLNLGINYYPLFSVDNWTLPIAVNNVGIFTRTVVVSSVSRDATTGSIVSSGGILDTGTKLVTVHVSWMEGATTVTKVLPFYIMDIF